MDKKAKDLAENSRSGAVKLSEEEEDIKALSESAKVKTDEVILAYFDMENYLSSEDCTVSSIDVKSAMIWGALWILVHSGNIDSHTRNKLYGSFMSHQMGLS